MKKHQMMPEFKLAFEKETGIKLDFRTMAYLANDDDNYPVYDPSIFHEVRWFLGEYLDGYIKDNKHQYPDFNGFDLGDGVKEIKKARAGTLKSYIEDYITELFQRKVTAKKHKPVLDRGEAKHPNNILMTDNDAVIATEIGRGNKSLGVRMALRGYTQ